MSPLFKISFVTILQSTLLFANTNLNLGQFAKAEDVPFDLQPTTEEFRVGEKISNLFIELSKNNLSNKEVSAIAASSANLKMFSSYKKSLGRLVKVSVISDQNSFYENCTNEPPKKENIENLIEEKANNAIGKYCRNLFLKRMAKLPVSMNLSSRDYNFLKVATPSYLTGESQPELVQFLRNFKSNRDEHEKISKTIIEGLYELKIRPSTALLTSLKLSADFNRFLQKNPALDDSTTTYFHEEFQRSYKDAQEALENGNLNLAKQLANGAYNFYQKNKSFISEKRAFIGFTILGKAFFYKDQPKDAIDLFEKASTIAGKEDYSDSQYNLIWPYIVDKDFKGLKQAIEKYSLEKNFERFDSKVQYWVAQSAAKNYDEKKAEELFNKIVTNSPYSFYTIIALKDLSSISNNKISEKDLLNKLIAKETSTEIEPSKYDAQLKNALKRFNIWNKISNERFQTIELKYIQNFEADQIANDKKVLAKLDEKSRREFLTLNLIKLLNSKKRFVHSIHLFQDAVEQNSLTLNLKLIKQLFPFNYYDVIKKNSLNIDPLIVISLIRQESAFNPDANSGVGAKGLMQLMPTTAKRFNSKVKTRHLSNPSINVAIGTKYLKNLISKFDGNLIFALASYNAGENRIDRWRREIFRNNDPLATIEAIPFEETRNYVKLIYRNYFFYNLLNNKSILMKPIEETFKVSLYDKNL